MSLDRAVVSVVSIFLGLSAAVAQQAGTATNNAAASASSALTNPPVFQGLMVDGKGKTVGRYMFSFNNNLDTGSAGDGFLGGFVVRQISGIWVLLVINDFKAGFTLIDPSQDQIQFYYQSTDCTGTAYLPVNARGSNYATAPAFGYVMTIPPATAPTIYFAGTPLGLITPSSRRYSGSCLSAGDPVYVGPAQNVPVSSLGLTPPFSIK
jgi:hypothetical protein